MKTKNIWHALLLTTLLVVFVMTFSACNGIFFLHINLNGGEYTEEFASENGFDSTKTNYSKGVNRLFNDTLSLPNGNDIVAPKGKVFAGWYFKEKNEADPLLKNYWCRKNWEAITADENVGSATIYAKWIDAGNIVLNFMENSETETYRDGVTSSFVFKPEEYAAIQSRFPNQSSFNLTQDYIFEGWYFYRDGKLQEEFSPALLASKLAADPVNAYFNVAAKWTMRPVVYLNYVIDYKDIENGYQFTQAFIASGAQGKDIVNNETSVTFKIYLDQLTQDFLDMKTPKVTAAVTSTQSKSPAPLRWVLEYAYDDTAEVAYTAANILSQCATEGASYISVHVVYDKPQA